MGETTTLSVDPATGERFRRLKAELDAEQSDTPDHTVDSFLNALLDTWEDGGQNSRTHEILRDVGADPEAIAAAVWANAEYGRLAKETADEVEARLR